MQKMYGITLILTGLLAGVTGCSEPEHPAAPNAGCRVRTMAPRPMEFARRLKIHMNAEPIEHADICAKVPGVIESFAVRKGDRVKAGDRLFQTDKFQLEANLDITRQELKVLESSRHQAELRIAVAEEQRKKAEMDYRRNQRLHEQKAVSKDKFEQFELFYVEASNAVKLAEADYDHARIKVEQAQNNIRIAERRYQDSIMLAPFDAKVVETYYEEWEHAENAKRVLRLESPRLELTALVPADYYSTVQTGITRAEVLCLNTGYRSSLPVSYKGVYIDPASRTFEIKIELPESAQVLSGMLCEADIILGTAEGYGLPNEAFLAQAGGKWAVFSVADGSARKHVMVPTFKDGDWSMLDCPEKPVATMRFVVEGQAFLDDGAAIEEMR